MSRQQAAHRLKNMLTVIAGRSHTAMALADDNPELLAELQAINSTVQRSHTLLRNLFPVDKTPEEPLHPRKVHKEL